MSGKRELISFIGAPASALTNEEIVGGIVALTEELSRRSSEATEVTRFNPGRTPPGLRDDAWKGSRVAERQVERVLKFRSMRANMLPAEFFGEPAWDLLLHLMLSYLRDEAFHTATLAASAGLDDDLTLQILAELENEGLIAGGRDPTDERHVLVWLTDKGARKMALLINEL